MRHLITDEKSIIFNLGSIEKDRYSEVVMSQKMYHALKRAAPGLVEQTFNVLHLNEGHMGKIYDIEIWCKPGTPETSITLFEPGDKELGMFFPDIMWSKQRLGIE